MKEPTLPTMLVVGAARYRAGTKIETVQTAIDRVYERYSALDKIIWQARQHKHRLPPDLEAAIDAYWQGAHSR